MDAIKDYHIITKILHTSFGHVSGWVEMDQRSTHQYTTDDRCRGLKWIGNPFC